MAHNFIRKFDIMVSDGRRLNAATDEVIMEIPLEIIMDGRRIITIACTGHHPEELAAGYLRAEGLIEHRSDIIALCVSDEGTSVTVTTAGRLSACGKFTDDGISLMSSGARKKRQDVITGPLTSGVTVRVETVLRIMKDLLSSSTLHERTHGAHCSALADNTGILVFRDDIGRHNTIDMLGGHALLTGIACTDKFLATTGRISTEIVSKVFNLGIPVIISHSAATSRAVRFADDAGITLIGFVRGETMKIYAHERRVTL
ncbi:MAG: formate dehydrogenase accessory sulfurtransferase FdhD [Deltaproteobacteria bacterium]|nr:formate dehydrogenase accessory sulfurtransferase FdhD [Deltaproteobacteria bacterium]